MKKIGAILGLCLVVASQMSAGRPNLAPFALNERVQVTFRGVLPAPIADNVWTVNVELPRNVGTDQEYKEMYSLPVDIKNLTFVAGGRPLEVQAIVSGGIKKNYNNGKLYDVEFGDVLIDHISASQIKRMR